MSLEQRVKALESLVQNLIKVGKVSVIDADACAVRVTFPDRDNVQSAFLKVMVENTLNNKDYWMPEVGEDVLCIFLPNGREAGFVLGGYYVDGVGRPAASADLRVTQFADGGRIEYNRATGAALVKAVSTVVVDAPDSTVTGTLTVQGLLTYQDGISGSGGSNGNSITGDLVVDGISVPNHGHIENDVGGRTSDAVE
jgi:phage baseplate assembly protein V